MSDASETAERKAIARTSAKVRQLVTGKVSIFDERPIELEGFRLTHFKAQPLGSPSIQQFQAALAFSSATVESSPYWVGDLCAYADSRADWREKLSQAVSITGLAEQTIHNYGHVARCVAEREREIAPSHSHSAAVASLDAPEQREWLTKARTEGWTAREMAMELRAAKRRGIIEGQAELTGQFRVFYVDCPWTYSDYQTGRAGAKEHYPGMSVDELMKLPITAHAQKNAVMFFWVTSPMLYYASDPALGPDPYRVLRAWGFEPKTGMVWDKVKHNFGNYVSVRHEHLIIATRGSCTPDRPTPMPDSVITEQRTDTHSEKPQIFRKVIEKLYDGPYVELFARKPVKGWTTWGNQVLSDVTAR